MPFRDLCCGTDCPGLSLPAALQVLARAGGRYSMVQVREAVDALQNEGHLYSTIDENHFKVGLG